MIVFNKSHIYDVYPELYMYTLTLSVFKFVYIISIKYINNIQIHAV